MTDDTRFHKHNSAWFSAVEHCISNNLTMPALALIYSGIDAIAWVTYGDIPVKKRFILFVEEHMYEEKRLLPRPIDLYAARCSILHTLTPDSDLSHKGEARVVSYAWGTAELKPLIKASETLAPGKSTFVHLSDLFESYRLGFSRAVQLAQADPDCIGRMRSHYSFTSTEDVDAVNRGHI